MRQLIARLLEHMKVLDRQVNELEAQIKAWHRGSELSRKLEKIPGIGAAGGQCAGRLDCRRQELQERSPAGGLAGAGA